MYIKYINKVYNIIKLSLKSIEKNVFYFCVPFKKLSKHDYVPKTLLCPPTILINVTNHLYN